MARLAKGTTFTVNADYRTADLALRAVQAFSIANPSVSPSNGAPELCADLDRKRRKAYGSKLTMALCPGCQRVNPHVSIDLRTECCGSRTLTVCA